MTFHNIIQYLSTYLYGTNQGKYYCNQEDTAGNNDSDENVFDVYNQNDRFYFEFSIWFSHKYL